MAYIRICPREKKYLFETDEGDRLTYSGLLDLIDRWSKKAGIYPPPPPHSFRRAFALNSLRNGIDLFTLSKLLGHSDLSLLRRYIRLLPEDLQIAHSKYSPVDNF